MRQQTLFTMTAIALLGIGCTFPAPDGQGPTTQLSAGPIPTTGETVEPTRVPIISLAPIPSPSLETQTNTNPVLTEVTPGIIWHDRLLLGDTAHADVVAFSDDGSTVLYFRQTTGLGSDLYITRVATGETRIVDHNVVSVMPHTPIVLSPDGDTVLYRRTLDGGAGSWHNMWDLWAWNWESNSPFMLSAGVMQAAYRFTPDSGHVLFVSKASQELVLYNLLTDESHLLSNQVIGNTNNGEQFFPMSDDGRYLAYVRGYPSHGILHLVDLWTLNDIELSNNVVNRSARFLGEGWLSYQVDNSQGTFVVHHEITTGDFRMTEAGQGFKHSPDGRFVAHMDTDNDDLLMWSRDLNETIEIDSGTSYGLYDFSPSSAHLVYYRHLEASGLGLIGKLYAMRTDTEERDRLADKAWTESHAPEFTFLSDGLHVAYKASACGWYNNLRVVNLATQTVTTIEGATCGARYAQPDGGGLVFDAVEPSRLMEYSLDNKQTIQLATDPISQQSSPNGVITVHTLKPDAASVATVLLTNWDSRTVRTITSPGADLSIQHITNTHAVFKTTDSTEGMPTQLWLVELPQ